VAILAAAGDSVRDITVGHPGIDADGVLTAGYTNPGPSGEALVRFQYPEAPGGPERVWLSAPEPGRSEFRLPVGAPPTAPGEGAIPLLPSVHGFRFVNHFGASPVPALETGLGIQLNAFGLCGGMSFAAADLFLADRPRPDATTPPPAGTPLYDYIYHRQADSLGGLAVEGLRFGRWMGLPGRTIAGTNKRTYDELAGVRAALDSGLPAVLGLVYIADGDRRAVWQNHQVLAFGYHSPGDGTIVFRVYDPNYPGRDDVTIRAAARIAGTIDDPASPGHSLDIPGVECRQFIGKRDLRPVRGFFVMPYSPAGPPDDLSSVAPGALPRPE
jgi:hypothetical protein